MYIEDSDKVELVCEVYGYPRDSSLPVWTHGRDAIQNECRHTITVSNTHLLGGRSIPINERVVSVLSIVNVVEDDGGEYTCSVTGNSSTVILAVNPGKYMDMYQCVKLHTCAPSVQDALSTTPTHLSSLAALHFILPLLATRPVLVVEECGSMC